MCLCVLARINIFTVLLSRIPHWLAIPTAYDTASGCTKLHMFRIQITRYYEFMVKMFKTIYSLWKWMWCTLLNLSHFNMPHRISLTLLELHCSYFGSCAFCKHRQFPLCTSNRLIKHHHSLRRWFLISHWAPFEYYTFLKCIADRRQSIARLC